MKYILIAFLSAIFFGSSVPVGKYLLEDVPPLQLAGLLYLGAALGVLPFLFKEEKTTEVRAMGRKNQLRLLGAICFGGIIGPVLLLFGLSMATASSVSMWLNLELVATAVLGYILFKDHLGVYGWIGVLGTIIASVVLSGGEGHIGFTALLLVAGAAVCWGLDNHLTALIDGITPSQSTFWKGLVAGTTNTVLSVCIEDYNLAVGYMAMGLLVGIFAYGFSISLYILAAQNLGATRAQMIFASAPFFGVVLSVPVLGESISQIQAVAAVILVASLVVLMRDQHAHKHTHEAMRHKHMHRHDDGHHHHEHAVGEEGVFHSHWHEHEPITHSHPHWPDIHHRHTHSHD